MLWINFNYATNGYTIYKNFKKISYMHTILRINSIYQFKLLSTNTKYFNYTTFILYKYYSVKT
jgi:hypothetical protein